MTREPGIEQSVLIDPTQAESASSLQTGAQYAQLDAGVIWFGRRWLNTLCQFALFGTLGFLAFYLPARLRWESSVGSFVALVVIFWGFAYYAQRRLLARIALAAAVPCRVVLTETGIGFLGESGGSFIQWKAIRAVESRHDAIVLVLRNYSVMHLPHRCFTQREEIDRFLNMVTRATGLTAETQKMPQTVACADDSSVMASLRALLSNIWAGILLALFMRRGGVFLRASVPQYIFLTAVALLVYFGFDLARIGLDGEFNWSVLPYLLWGTPGVLFCAWLAARESNAPERAMLCAVAIAAIGLFLSVSRQLSYLLPPSVWEMEYLNQIIGWLPAAWYVLAVLTALVRLGPLPARRWGGVFAAFLLVMLTTFFVSQDISYPALWQARYDDSEAQANRQRQWQTLKESVLYAQPELLADMLAKIAPGRPGVADLYLVGVAGYGSQDVFLREVKSVSDLFAQRFDTAGRSVELINNPDTVLTQPIASVTALEWTLNAIGERMNRDEDVLFLFMTSHGAQKAFSLQLWPYRFDDLTPERLRQMLDASRIKNRVIVVSACYSGSFTEPLANDDTLVISASRADRNSHGCSHEAEWTFFGQAYFNEALRQTLSFTEAFDEAQKNVAVREVAEDYVLSEPQMLVGRNIGPVLQGIQKRLEAEAQQK